ncbi:hypothetical protein ACP4OV_012512 [Aristida adscensionis]
MASELGRPWGFIGGGGALAGDFHLDGRDHGGGGGRYYDRGEGGGSYKFPWRGSVQLGGEADETAMEEWLEPFTLHFDDSVPGGWLDTDCDLNHYFIAHGEVDAMPHSLFPEVTFLEDAPAATHETPSTPAPPTPSKWRYSAAWTGCTREPRVTFTRRTSTSGSLWRRCSSRIAA